MFRFIDIYDIFYTDDTKSHFLSHVNELIENLLQISHMRLRHTFLDDINTFFNFLRNLITTISQISLDFSFCSSLIKVKKTIWISIGVDVIWHNSIYSSWIIIILFWYGISYLENFLRYYNYWGSCHHRMLFNSESQSIQSSNCSLIMINNL